MYIILFFMLSLPWTTHTADDKNFPPKIAVCLSRERQECAFIMPSKKIVLLTLDQLCYESQIIKKYTSDLIETDPRKKKAPSYNKLLLYERLDAALNHPPEHRAGAWHLLEQLSSRYTYLPPANNNAACLLTALIKARFFEMHSLKKSLLKKFTRSLMVPTQQMLFWDDPDTFENQFNLDELNAKEKVEISKIILAPYQNATCLQQYTLQATLQPQSKLLETTKLLFSTRNNYILSFGKKACILYLWNLKNQTLEAKFNNQFNVNTQVAFSNDDTSLAISRGHNIVWYDIQTHTKTIFDAGLTQPISSLYFDLKDNGLIASNYKVKDPRLIRWDIHQAKAILSCAKVFKELYSCPPAYHPNGRTHAMGTVDGSLEIVQSDGRKQLDIDSTTPIAVVAFSNDGTHVAAASKSGIIKVYKHSTIQNLSIMQALLFRLTLKEAKETQTPINITANSKHHEWFTTLPDAIKEKLAASLNIRKQGEH